MDIYYLQEAENDLEQIVFYYLEQVSPAFGLEVYSRISRRIEDIAIFPKSIKASERVAGTRELVIPDLPYVVFVRIREDLDRIEVLRILHTAMRFPG